MNIKNAERGNASWMGVNGYTSDLKVLIDVTARLHKSESVEQCAELGVEGAVSISLADDCCLHLGQGQKFRRAGKGFSEAVHTILSVESYFTHSFEPVKLGAAEVVCAGPEEELYCLLIPIVGREEKLHGVLQLARKNRDGLSAKQICTLKNLALSLAIALENLDGERVPLISGGVPAAHGEVELLRKALAGAEAASSAKSKYLASISHEIRNPLGVILGLSEIALENSELPAETRDFLNGIQRNGQQLSNILGNVLDILKIEAGRLELEVIEFNLADFLAAIRDDFGLSVTAKGKVRFVLEAAAGLPAKVATDPTKLRQILMNLLNNALKFTNSGEISLQVELSDAASGFIFRVSDSGIGIAEEHRDRLFRSFSQVEASTSRRYGGSGLGLMLSRQMARALGGDLILSASELGRGSQFTLDLPLGNLSSIYS